MKKLTKLTSGVISFFVKQNFVIVSSIAPDGSLHNSCKGIVDVNSSGRIYLLDLYLANTFKNIKNNPVVSVTAVDEHKFEGYCLKGKASIVRADQLQPKILQSWEEKINYRVVNRLVKNIRGERGHISHPEAHLPRPQYMMVIDVEEVINLNPNHQKRY